MPVWILLSNVAAGLSLGVSISTAIDWAHEALSELLETLRQAAKD